MNLLEFNETTSHDIEAFLMCIAHVPSWASTIARHRPYGSKEVLLNDALTFAQQWDWAEIEIALSKHPKLGEKQAKTELSKQEQVFSQKEQGFLAKDQNLTEQLVKYNQDYENKFGFIFLMNATGRSQQDVLKGIENRINNDLKTEQRIVKEQLLQILHVRLNREITE